MDKSGVFEKLLESKRLQNFWQKLASGEYLVIYKNGKNHFLSSNKKTWKARINDIEKQYKDLVHNPEVVAFIWSAQSWDSYYFFCNYIAKKQTGLANKIIQSPREIISTYYKKLTEPYPFQSKKDRHIKILIKK